MEIWKDIKGFEGIYQISNLGRVKSLERSVMRRNGKILPVKEKILKNRINNFGYARIGLRKNKKYYTCSVHILVANAFIPNPNNYPLVNHKDENKANNTVENLEWCTHAYNNTYGTRTERAAHKQGKCVLCVETGIIYWSIAEASRQTGINQGNLSKACSGKYETMGGYHWKYV